MVKVWFFFYLQTKNCILSTSKTKEFALFKHDRATPRRQKNTSYHKLEDKARKFN